MKKLPTFSLKNLESNEISIFGGTLTDKCITECIALTKMAFPSLPLDFYRVLIDRIREVGFDDERLCAAVKRVIDTCRYPTPTVAEFISFDIKIKVYSYNDICNMVEKGDKRAFENHKRIMLKGLPEAVWVHVNDCESLGKYLIKDLLK